MLRLRLGESLLPQVKSCLGGLSKLDSIKLLYFNALLGSRDTGRHTATRLRGRRVGCALMRAGAGVQFQSLEAMGSPPRSSPSLPPAVACSSHPAIVPEYKPKSLCRST